MLQYPSIRSWRKLGGWPRDGLAFVKYDGSNLRWEWTPKRGWSKFGTRNHLFDQTEPTFGPAIDLFQQTLAGDILKAVERQYGRPERITAFTEFFGPNSFAGIHLIEDPKELRLIDVSVFKKGFLAPKVFHKLFHDHPFCAELLFQDRFNKQFFMDIDALMRPVTQRYPFVEGLVVRGNDYAAKVKTRVWLEELRRRKPEVFKEESEMAGQPLDDAPEPS